MSEQAPKYDSTIQDLFVTDGEDIGRVKDKEFAHEVAKKYNDERNRELNLQAEGRTEVIPLTNEADTAGSNHILKHEVGRYAINNNDGIAQLERDIAGIGMGTRKEIHSIGI